MKLEGDLPYSFVECRNMCIHKKVIKECGSFPTFSVTRNKNHVENCAFYLLSSKTKRKEMIACQTRELKNIADINYVEECNCHRLCDDVTFSATMSHFPWHNKNVLNAFLFHTLRNHPNKSTLKAYQHDQKFKNSNATNDEIYQWVKSHYLRLNVYAKSNIVSVKEQVPMYTLTDLLCKIGGCLGLWVGMSVITILEIFDLVLNVLVRICKVTNKLETHVTVAVPSGQTISSNRGY